MPRPKNFTLRELFYDSENPAELVCSYGSCNGRILSDRAGNLERHLRTMHPAIFANYVKQKNTHVSKVSEGGCTTIRVQCEFQRRNAQAAIAEIFTRNCLPLRMVEDRAFQTLVKPVFDALKISMSTHNVLEQTASYFTCAKEYVKKDLKGRMMSLKIDVAIRQNISALVIGVQYVKNGCIKRRTLAIQTLEDNQSITELNPYIVQILEEYEISTNQIISITTDNGAYKENVSSNSGKDNNLWENATKHLQLMDTKLLAPEVYVVACGLNELYECVQVVLESTPVLEQLENWKALAQKIQSNVYCDPPLNFTNSSGWYNICDMFESLHDTEHTISISSIPIEQKDWDFLEQSLSAFEVVRHCINELQSPNLCISDFYAAIMDIIFKLQNLPQSDVREALLESFKQKKLNLLECDLFVTAVFLDPRLKITLTLGQIVRAKTCVEQLRKRLISLKENVSGSAQQICKTMEAPSSVNNEPRTLEELLQSLDNNTGQFSDSLNEMDDSNQTCSSSLVEKSLDEICLSLETDMLRYNHQKRLPLDENILEYWSLQNNSLSCIANVVLAIPFCQTNTNRTNAALNLMVSEESKTLSRQQVKQILFLKTNDIFKYV